MLAHITNAGFLACVWYGVQSYIGGHCVYLMIRSIWKSWDRDTIPNTFSESSGTTTADFVSFFLFWLCSLPAIWFPVHKIRHLFTVKAFIVPCAGIAFLGWAVGRAGGIGPIVKQPATIHGSELGWQMVKGIMSAIANFSTLIVNDCRSRTLGVYISTWAADRYMHSASLCLYVVDASAIYALYKGLPVSSLDGSSSDSIVIQGTSTTMTAIFRDLQANRRMLCGPRSSLSPSASP